MDQRSQHVLYDIERNLQREDPAFAARMRPDNAAGPSFPTVSALCASCYILAPVVMVLFSWPAVVLTVTLFAGLIGAVLVRRRHRRLSRIRPGRRDPRR